MFIDELDIYVQAGAGGGGAVSFRRERFVEFGGPDGGNGGDGGSVILRVAPKFNTLMPLRNRRHYRARRGRNGRGSNMTGATGEDLVLEVPPGTMVRDRETGALLADLTLPDEEMTAAMGGRGGKGNKHFTTSTHRAPKFAQPGLPGETRWLSLELKVMADIGLVGFPNAGKSTLISRISAARPKVADYPFTTLEPNLGVVKVDQAHGFVVADIPGVIENAHQGAGLGARFLRHIERTRLLLLVIDPCDPERLPRAAWQVLLRELRSFSPILARKPWAVAFTKADAPPPDPADLEAFTSELRHEGNAVYRLSAVSGQGVKDLIFGLHRQIADLAPPEPDSQDDGSHETPTEGEADEDRASTDPLDLI